MKRLLPFRVLVPIILGMLVALAVVGVAEIGYRRLEFANRAMSTALEMETVVNQTLALIIDAESSQRGYLLTGDPSYLKPYEDALPKIDRSFARLRALVDASGTTSMIEHADRLNGLIGRKLNDLEATLALKQRDGPDAALQLLDTGVGRRLTDQIRGEAESILDELSQSARRAAMRWASDIEFGRVGMLTMSAFTLVLLLVVWAL
ncbi:MAG TPA: CHASE3 domain-containing protein, partial [Vicinamibacterales bacterium]|nr:CHASE3 domain-containing protein [Vicinamibacterales bacterium]